MQGVRRRFFGLFGLAPVLLAAPASANTRESVPMRAPHEALELTISAGYAPAAIHEPLSGGAGGGIGSEVGLAVRSSRWSVGLVGQYAELGHARGEPVFTASGAASATYHARPGARIEPWLSAGSGYRYLRTAGESAHAHGWEIARLAAGADLLASPVLAAGPFASAGLDLFPSSTNGDASLSVIAFIGIRGRFDLSPAIVGD